MPLPSPLGRDFINRFQGGFPLCDRPFRVAAADLETEEATLIAAVQGLLADGNLTRFGPLYDAERLGGRFTLAAMAVPEGDFDRIARMLEASPEVAHNYRRDHALNMWFVLATPSDAGLQATIRRIQSATGLVVHDFPKLKEYHLGFWLQLGEDSSIGVRRVERERPGGPLDLDPLDRALVAATQAGLPLVPEPYASVAADIGADHGTVLARLQRLLEGGAIRRIGAVPNHYHLGLRGNGMSVWNIDDTEVDALGERVGALEEVSHCYRRPRRLPLWPYNLFAMVHGRDRAEVLDAAKAIEALVAGHCRGHRVLFSEAVLKKTGLRFVA
jgi:DNA-binding Lrp family transcriptional regulator